MKSEQVLKAGKSQGFYFLDWRGVHGTTMGQQATNLFWQGGTHHVVTADPVCQGSVSLDWCAHKPGWQGWWITWPSSEESTTEEWRSQEGWIYSSVQRMGCLHTVYLSHVLLSGIARIQASFSLIKCIISWGLEYLTNSRYKERSPHATFVQSVAICCSYYGVEVGTCVWCGLLYVDVRS